MNILLIILFAITLIYLSITERFRIYTILIGLQGFILFLLAFFELEVVTIGSLIFVATETLLFKVILVPYFLNRIIKKTGVSRVHDKALPGFYSLLFVAFGLVLSILVAHSLNAPVDYSLYFIVSLFAVFTGLFIIISHKKVFSHLIGFLIIENAVLLLSMALGSGMPVLINIGILLDIFVSVLILGIFIMRLKQHTNQLTMLKDE